MDVLIKRIEDKITELEEELYHHKSYAKVTLDREAMVFHSSKIEEVTSKIDLLKSLLVFEIN